MKRPHPKHKHVVTQEPVSQEASQEPPLVGCYKNAVRGICSVVVRVPSKYFPAFRRIQDRLDSLGIAYDRYAWVVVKTHWPYCQEKKIRYVPVPMFVADKTWALFAAAQDSTVRIDTKQETDWHRKVHDEMMAAMAFIGSQLNRQPIVLSWVRSMCNSTGEERVVQEVMALLNELYGCDCKSYQEIANLLGEGVHISERLAQRVTNETP